MPDLTFRPWLELLGITAQTLFTISYFIFVFHIWHNKRAAGVSAFAISQWFVAFSMLAVYFYIKWHPAFFSYYVVGAVLSIAAIEGVRRYK